MSDLAALGAALADVRLGEDPDRWALAAYRLAVAKSELVSRPAELVEALGLLEQASRVLTAQRAPLEHSRILTATASCHRAAGRTSQAVALFEQAAELAGPRASLAERAASLVNVGLTQAEAGRAGDALAALDAAIALLDNPTDDEGARLLGAALVNRAQAHQANGDDESLEAAVKDYEAALGVLAVDGPQAGMAAHGLGAAQLERHRRTPTAALLDAAMVAFERALVSFGPTTHRFQHAVVRHSAALAYEQRGLPGDLARALNSVEASLVLFDPRLHQAQWRTAVEALARFERKLDESDGPRSRMGHIVGLLATLDGDARTGLLRERLRNVASQPRPRLEAELEALTSSLVERSHDEYQGLLVSLIAVLMELPDGVLDVACQAICLAHGTTRDTVERDRILDEVIHDILFGPQRVRVRDLLEANGWVRP